MRKIFAPINIITAFSLITAPFAAHAMGDNQARDKGLKKPIQIEKDQLDEKAILQREERQVIPSKGAQSGAAQQRGVDAVAPSLESPMTAALDELDRANKDILAALREFGVLEQMRRDFYDIEKAVNADRRLGLIKQYQSRYKQSYRRALQKVGVDLEGIALKLSVEIPGIEFIVRDGVEITAKSSAKTVQSLAPLKKAAQTYVLSDDDFTYTSNGDCALLAGTRSGFEDGELVSSATAIIAGGCTQSSSAVYSLDDYINHSVTAKYDLSVSNAAGSVLGASGVNSYSRVYTAIGGSKSASCTLLAPIFWLSHCIETFRNIELVGNITESEWGSLRLETDHFVIGALGVAAGTSKVALKNSEITISE